MKRRVALVVALVGISAGVLMAGGCFSLDCCAPSGCYPCPAMFCAVPLAGSPAAVSVAGPALSASKHFATGLAAGSLEIVSPVRSTVASFHGALSPMRI